MNTTHELLPEAMYEMNAAGYCGVFMPRRVMEKLVTLTHKHMMAVRELLEANKADLYPSHWTMAHNKETGGAEYLRFVLRDEKDAIDRRISLFRPNQLERRDEVLVVGSYDEAKKIVDERLARKEAK